jgi:RHS repeat-associated protein
MLMMTYTRGNDLSGTLQGAGGIGGLLARSDHSQPPSPYYSVHSYYHADGNGNVTMLVNASQMMVAKYLYDPYGNTLSMSGPLAAANTYRFSSKEWNNNAGYYYYLYRYYDPNLQRWLNRDPSEEEGGINLYDFVANNPLDQVDFLGLTIVQSMQWFPGSIPEGSGGNLYIRTMDDGQPLNIVCLRHLTEGDIKNEEDTLRQELAAFKITWGGVTRKKESGFDTKWFQGVNGNRQYYWISGQSEIYADNEINYLGIGMYEAWLGDSPAEAAAITWIWKQQYPGPIPSGTWYWLRRGYSDYKN